MSSKQFSTHLDSNQILFFAGLFLKIVLGSLFASNVLTDLFIPFIDYFAENFSDPYRAFIHVGPRDHFPYPAVMLYVLALPKILLGWIAPHNPFFQLFLYRIPLLMADVSIFLILRAWFKNQSVSKIIWFYWLSPVLIYISYIHGQLDVIPISLLFMSLFFLLKEKKIGMLSLSLSALLLGLSLATKTNVALVYPFFFLFLISKGLTLKHLSFFMIFSLSVFLIVNLNFLFSPAFIEMVFQNREQGKLLSAYFLLDQIPIYIIPCLVFLLFLRGISLKHYNRDIFIMFLGFSFSLILLFIPPMPGWYFWLLPFLAYFYIKENKNSKFLFFGLQGFYILYFISFKDADYLQVFQILSPDLAFNPTIYTLISEMGLDADRVVGIVFTGLQTMLFVNCVFIYQKGLKSYTQHKLLSSPFLVGIGGNSAVGKSTISDTLLEIFTPFYTTVLRGDDMHKWQRGHEKWNELTHLDPKANELHKEINFLKRLKAGQKIKRREYDHNTGRFTKEATISSNNLIVFEGLHPFYLNSQASLYDLKIFLNPTTDLLSHWKIVRDTEERSASRKKVLEFLKKREKDSHKYIKPQRDRADLVIEPKPVKPINNIGDKREAVDVYYDLLLSNEVYLESLIEALQSVSTLNIQHEYMGEAYQHLVLKGDCGHEDIVRIGNGIITGLEDLDLTFPKELQGLYGVLMLIITYYIFEKANSEDF